MKTAVLLAVLISLACGFVHGQAQEKVLWTFTGTPDGWGHKSKLVLDNHGNLYGTTLGGGTVLTQECGEESGCGMVYELSPLPDGTWTEKIIYSFCNANNDYTCPDGEGPWGGLAIDKSGNLYGTTQGGGANAGGVVFELTPPSIQGGPWTESVLYNFCSDKIGSECVDGQWPASDLILDEQGNLYGTTADGGTGHISSNIAGAGTVFVLTRKASGWTHTVLYSFCSQGQGHHCPDGAYPNGGVTLREGTLYGVTAAGGTSDYYGGTVYELSRGSAGWTETVIYNFTSSIGGYNPEGQLSFGFGGELFGTVYYGGANGLGAVFRLGEGGAYGDVAPATGRGPASGMLIDPEHKVLYGTTIGGGNNFGGTVFQVSASGEATTLYAFCSQLNCIDGSEAGSGLIEDASGNLYGTTVAGGTQTGFCVDGGCGVVYEIIP